MRGTSGLTEGMGASIIRINELRLLAERPAGMCFLTTPPYDSRQHIVDALTRHEQHLEGHIVNINASEQDMKSEATP